MASDIYYHIAPAEYRLGEDLHSRYNLLEMGYDVPWKWDEADEGTDSNVVCLFEEIEEAMEFVGLFLPGGQILKVDLSDVDPDDPVSLTWVEEGYRAAVHRIPACYITAAIDA